MQKSARALVMTAALFAGSGIAFAQSSPTPAQPVPGFATDQRPGVPGSNPANSGSNVGSNVGAGATASPVDNGAMAPGGPAANEPATTSPSLFGLSRQFPLDKK
ncbi:MAG: hypothetical protein JSR47_16445 [Proteobacteria bacterium]|nr:hypothetical protein [Pseudomonadota bacterium]